MRTLNNLKLAMELLSDVRVFDNDDLNYPYRLVARCENGRVVTRVETVPEWVAEVVTGVVVGWRQRRWHER